MLTDAKKILVTGGAGYIGSHMVLALKEAGFTPVVLDNLSKGHKDSVVGTEFIYADVADKKRLQELFRQQKFLAVMHFAAFIEVAESVQNPDKYFQNNYLGTLNLLEVMRENDLKYFIFSSTAAVYGEPQYTPIDEAHSLAPINPYGESKYKVEKKLQEYAKNNDFVYASLRYFNAAGADPLRRVGERHEPESHLIPLILQVARGKKKNISVFGRDYATSDGTCVRDYVHVTDLCAAHLLALKKILSEDKYFICNLGTGHGYSVQEVIEAVQRVTQKPIPIIEAARRPGDPAVLVANADLAKELLGWQPQYGLEDIVRHAWEFEKKLSQ